MITDDERREVAEKLRASIPGDVVMRRGDKGWSLLYRTIFGHYMGHQSAGRTYSEVAGRLADLIEPSIPADPGEAGLACVDAFIREHTEKPVDRDTPQKVAEEMWKVAEEVFGDMRHSTKEEADAYEAMLKSKSVELHPVDRDALLALADEMESELDECADDHEIVGKLQYRVDRIREALGKGES